MILAVKNVVRLRFHFILFLFCDCIASSFCTRYLAAQSYFAQVPPMGWNSWDAYGTTVREDEVKANANVMATELAKFGWQYIVVDIQWYERNARSHGYRENAQLDMDDYGRLMPATNRFPSAANAAGFKTLADYIHSRGLKFGIHILRGIPRQAVARNTPIYGTALHAQDIADTQHVCRWNTDMYGVDMSKPGAQAYYDSIVSQYAQWGVYFIKADDMSSPYHADEIAALHRAILKTGRPILLSLSPGPAPVDQVEDLRANAEMWRIEDDLWDDWKSIKNMYFRTETWAPLVTPGHWPDADMLPLGHIGIRAERGEDRLSRLTHDEQRTVMTLWGIFQSPLMFGGDLASLDPFTRSLLTNANVLAVSQHGSHPEVKYRNKDLRVWTSSADGARDKYVAIFNLSDSPETSVLKWDDIGIDWRPGKVRNLWTGKQTAAGREVKTNLAPHASSLLRVQ